MLQLTPTGTVGRSINRVGFKADSCRILDLRKLTEGHRVLAFALCQVATCQASRQRAMSDKMTYLSILLTSFMTFGVHCYSAKAVTPAPPTPPPPSGSCLQRYTGTSFYMTYMQTEFVQDLKLMLYVGIAINSNVMITFHTNYSSLRNQSPFNTPILLRSYEHTSVIISGQMQLNGSSITPTERAFYITATGEISVFGFYEQTGACGGFLVLPTPSLGTRYFISTLAPAPFGLLNFLSQIAIVGIQDNTVVNVTLPSGVFIQQVPTNQLSNSIQLILNKLQVIQLQSAYDLSGVEIRSTIAVAVFSGNVKTTIGGSQSDTTVEQIMPMTLAGVDYAIAPLPGNNMQFAVKVIATANNIQVNITTSTNSRSFSLSSSGESVTWNYGPADCLRLLSSGPIIVAQTSFGTMPTMNMIPPVNQYLTSYEFIVPMETSQLFTCYLLIICKTSTTLFIDGRQLNATYITVPGSSPNLVALTLNITPGYHFLYSNNQTDTFAAYVYGVSTTCAYSFPTGMCLDSFQPAALSTVASLVRTTPTSSIVSTSTLRTTPSAASSIRTTLLTPAVSTSTAITTAMTSSTETQTASRTTTPTSSSATTATAQITSPLSVSPISAVSVRTTPASSFSSTSAPRSTSSQDISTPASTLRTTPPLLVPSTATPRTTPLSATISPTSSTQHASRITPSSSTVTTVSSSAITRPTPPKSTTQDIYKTASRSTTTSSVLHNTTINVTSITSQSATTFFRPTPTKSTTLSASMSTPSQFRPTPTTTTNSRTDDRSTPTPSSTTTVALHSTPPTTALSSTTATTMDSGTDDHLTPIPSSTTTVSLRSTPVATALLSTIANTTPTTVATTTKQTNITMTMERATPTTTWYTTGSILTSPRSVPSSSSAAAAASISPLSSLTTKHSASTTPPLWTPSLSPLVPFITGLVSDIRTVFSDSLTAISGPNPKPSTLPMLTLLPTITPSWSSLQSQPGLVSNSPTAIPTVVVSAQSFPLSRSVPVTSRIPTIISRSLVNVPVSTTNALTNSSLVNTTTVSIIATTTTVRGPVTTTASTTTQILQTFTQTVTDCSCLYVSSRLQPNYTGNYYKISDSQYERADAAACFYIFVDNVNGVSYWLIGPPARPRTGVLVNSNSLVQPNYLTQGWRAYTENGFEEDLSTSVSCSCHEIITVNCSSVEFINSSTGSSVFDGVFTFMNTTSFGRPRYQFEFTGVDLWLLYAVLPTRAGIWMVTRGNEISRILMYAVDNSVSPPTSTSVHWKTSNETDLTGIKLSCL